MKLFRGSDHKEAKGQAEQAGQHPIALAAGWARFAALAGIVLIAFFGGMLTRQTGDFVPPALPASYGLAVITTTLPAPTATPAPTPAPLPDDALPTIYITISPTFFDQLEAVREKALGLGILLAEDNVEVPGTLRHDGTDMPAQISLKGDWTDHLRGDKWSLRVTLDDNHFLFGMAVFSLQNPPLRNYANEWAYHASLRREGVLGLRYRFVNVVLNGQAKGIYALEEGFSKELFEAQQRREGLILRYSENLMWTYRSLYDNRYVPRGVDAFHVIDEYQSAKIAGAVGLSAQRQAAVGMLRGVWTGQLRASDVFDVDQMGRFLALTNLWGGRHGLFWHNLRYFYNPLSTRIEPIGFNANALDDASPELDLPPEVFYGDPLLQAAYVKAALEISSPDYLSQLEAELGPQYAAMNQALSAEFGELPLPWDALRARAQQMRQRLEPYQAVYAYLPLGEQNLIGVVGVGNFLDWPVELVRLEIPSGQIPLQRTWVLSDSRSLLVSGTEALALLPLVPDAGDVAYAYIRIPQTALSLTATSEVTVVTRLLGADTGVQRQLAWKRYPLPSGSTVRPTATVEQALAQHPFLERDPDAKWLLVRPGDWSVTSDLVLPQGYGLHIGPGTTLRFGAGIIALVSGGPLLFEGEPDAPIVLTAADGAETWGGLVVLEAGAPSALSYVTFEKTGGLNRPGWGTTGGLNFFASPARLSHCRVLHIRNTDDAVNFVLSPFEVINTEFGDTFADAIDADFSSGTVEQSWFHDTGNDGLDISGTSLTARQLTMNDIGDKGISVGEYSQADIDGLTITRTYIGVAAKDGSHATLRNASISQAWVAGLAAYTKKTEYGLASLTASAIQFDGVEQQTLVQSGNWIDVDGGRVWGVEVDVEKLYLRFTKQH